VIVVKNRAVRHLLRRHSEGVGILVAAILPALAHALASLVHPLLAFRLERVVLLPLLGRQNLHERGVHP